MVSFSSPDLDEKPETRTHTHRHNRYAAHRFFGHTFPHRTRHVMICADIASLRAGIIIIIVVTDRIFRNGITTAPVFGNRGRAHCDTATFGNVHYGTMGRFPTDPPATLSRALVSRAHHHPCSRIATLSSVTPSFGLH